MHRTALAIFCLASLLGCQKEVREVRRTDPEKYSVDGGGYAVSTGRYEVQTGSYSAAGTKYSSGTFKQGVPAAPRHEAAAPGGAPRTIPR
jgi:hypothetical protein